ncbi:MAG: hypothetical protein EHM18_15625 [Acidobacteria bacterium]|nr:MAG: hypothetical protein EHM18_15625 [Acidobacteriota bacterium]
MEEEDIDLNDGYQTFRTKSGDTQEWRVVNRLMLHYSIENGNEADKVLLMQPVLSGFAMTQTDAPKPFLVLEDEFHDIFLAVES